MWFGITAFIRGPVQKTMDSRQTFNLNFELGSQGVKLMLRQLNL